MNSAAVDTVITGARYVLTCDDTGSVHERAGIAVRDGRIAAVGDVDSFDAHRRIDATDCLVLPGLINLHSLMLLVGLAKPREPSSLEREYPGIGARASFDEGADVVSTRLPRHSITT